MGAAPKGLVAYFRAAVLTDFSLTFSLPFSLTFSLPVHCLFTAFHCSFTAVLLSFRRLFIDFSLTFRCILNIFLLTSHRLVTAALTFSLPTGLGCWHPTAGGNGRGDEG